MSKAKVEELIEELPNSIKEQVLSYVKSVDDASIEIFKSSGIKYSKKLSDQLIFIAGIKKVFSMVDSIYWLIENSNSMLERNDMNSIRIGSTDLSRESQFYRELSNLRNELVEVLNENNLSDLISERQYGNILKALANEH